MQFEQCKLTGTDEDFICKECIEQDSQKQQENLNLKCLQCILLSHKEFKLNHLLSSLTNFDELLEQMLQKGDTVIESSEATLKAVDEKVVQFQKFKKNIEEKLSKSEQKLLNQQKLIQEKNQEIVEFYDQFNDDSQIKQEQVSQILDSIFGKDSFLKEKNKLIQETKDQIERSLKQIAEIDTQIDKLSEDNLEEIKQQQQIVEKQDQPKQNNQQANPFILANTSININNEQKQNQTLFLSLLDSKQSSPKNLNQSTVSNIFNVQLDNQQNLFGQVFQLNNQNSNASSLFNQSAKTQEQTVLSKLDDNSVNLSKIEIKENLQQTQQKLKLEAPQTIQNVKENDELQIVRKDYEKLLKEGKQIINGCKKYVPVCRHNCYGNGYDCGAFCNDCKKKELPKGCGKVTPNCGHNCYGCRFTCASYCADCKVKVDEFFVSKKLLEKKLNLTSDH